MNDWYFENPILFFGRLHPLLVHLPIGFLIALAMLEVASVLKRFRGARAARGILITLTVLSAIGAVVAGLMLETAGGYDEDLLALHKWLGIGLAVACIAMATAFWARKRALYGSSLVATLVLLVFASHFGGSITHGTDYLLAYAPTRTDRTVIVDTTHAPVLHASRPAQSEAPGGIPLTPLDATVFDAVIQPVMAELCISCHGPEKSKGHFRVDSLEALLKGGEEDGPAIVAGSASQSPMIRRLLLPIDDKDHMPPKGKRQPTPEQLAVLRWWIDSGATGDVTVAQSNPPEHIAPWIASVLGIESLDSTTVSTAQAPAPQPAVAAAVDPIDLEALAPQVAKATSELGVVVELVALGQPWLSINAAVVTDFGDEQLAQLAPLYPNIAVLNLAGTKVTDAGMVEIAKMPNLQRLRLERTAVTDAGLGHLAHNRKLEYLNLWGTAITDAGLDPLQQLPALRQLYLWRTGVTEEKAQAFAEARIDRSKIELLEQQIAALRRQIDSASIEVVHGMSTPAPVPEAQPAAEVVVAINTECPVSGAAINAAQFVDFEGRRVAFCCDKCKGKFEAEPAAFAAKLPPRETPAPDAAPAPETVVAVNTECPVSGAAINAAQFVDFEGRRVAFCCDKCKEKFEAEPAAFAAKLPPRETPAPDAAPAPVEVAAVEAAQPPAAGSSTEPPAEQPAAPTESPAPAETPAPEPAIANTTCPISGNPIDATKFVDHDGKRIAFCCDNCLAKFTADPAKFADKLTTLR